MQGRTKSLTIKRKIDKRIMNRKNNKIEGIIQKKLIVSKKPEPYLIKPVITPMKISAAIAKEIKPRIILNKKNEKP